MFYNGNFSTFASLKTSVEDALALNGWSGSDGIFSKNGMYVKLTASTQALLLEAGTGQSAGALTGAAPSGVKIFSPTTNPIIFPADYDLHIFTDTDEVYLVVNFNADKYQQLSWGKTQVEQVGGNGMWFTGTYRSAASAASTFGARLVQSNVSNMGFYRDNGGDGVSGGLFFEYQSSGAFPPAGSFIHTGLDATSWKAVASGDGGVYSSGAAMGALLQALPSAYNQNTVLLPLLAVQRRLSNGITVAGDLVHARLCRIDNHLPGEVVEYGGDSWKVYPFYRKNADARNGSNATSSDHSGTFAYAIRYTGP
jgi:hypothetical protein